MKNLSSGLKGYKERITVMACSNVFGTLKLPLVPSKHRYVNVTLP